MLKVLATLAMAAAGAVAAAQPLPNYAEGQVWEYRTRPSEEASRLKIQRIERDGEAAALGPVYHISITGVNVGPNIGPVLPHLPVSRETLEGSVTRLADDQNAAFPSADPGIAEWRQARGGVFTISVAAILDTVEEAMRRAGSAD
jgi:hypothetical protein